MSEHAGEDVWSAVRRAADRSAETGRESVGPSQGGGPWSSGSVLAMQRSAGNGAVAGVLEEERSPVHDVVASDGRALEPDVRADMEARLGHDFSDVRVHDDSAASASAAAVGAHAYTVGSSVVFQRDAYDPGSTQGRTTLAHELTHVVQQRQGAVDGSDAPGGIRVSDPSDRFEREAAATALRVTAGPLPVEVPAQGPVHEHVEADDLAPPALALQREGGGPIDEEEVEEEQPVV